jgi:DNA-binding NarL/FixJ family response regulator
MKQIRVLLVDDQPIVRSGFRALLESNPEIQVVAEAGDGQEALALIKQHQPDVVLMDITMPKMDGFEATARITKDFPGVHVIVVSVHTNEQYVRQALDAGAAGYLMKTAVPAELEQAIRIVASGNVYLGLRREVADHVLRKGGETSLERLTPRQREVLRLIAEGYSAKAIAFTLDISVKTVETHRAELMNRLNLHDIASLIRYAIETGLVSLED